MLRCTLRRLQRPPVKGNAAFETKPGQFAQSFEKMAGSIEEKMPFQMIKGVKHDYLFGEEHYMVGKKRAQDDLWGKKEEELSDVVLKHAYVDRKSLDLHAATSKSFEVRAKESAQRQKYSKDIVRTTKEASEFYYPVLTDRERQLRFGKVCAVWAGGVGLLAWGSLRFVFVRD